MTLGMQQGQTSDSLRRYFEFLALTRVCVTDSVGKGVRKSHAEWECSFLHAVIFCFGLYGRPRQLEGNTGKYIGHRTVTAQSIYTGYVF